MPRVDAVEVGGNTLSSPIARPTKESLLKEVERLLSLDQPERNKEVATLESVLKAKTDAARRAVVPNFDQLPKEEQPVELVSDFHDTQVDTTAPTTNRILLERPKYIQGQVDMARASNGEARKSFMANARRIKGYTREFITRLGPVTKDEDPFLYALRQIWCEDPRALLEEAPFDGLSEFQYGTVDIAFHTVRTGALHHMRPTLFTWFPAHNLLNDNMYTRGLGVNQEDHKFKPVLEQEVKPVAFLEDNHHQSRILNGMNFFVILMHTEANKDEPENPLMERYNPNDGGYHKLLANLNDARQYAYTPRGIWAEFIKRHAIKFKEQPNTSYSYPLSPKGINWLLN